MRYMAIHRGTEFDDVPSDEMQQQMGQLIGDMAAAGVLVSTGGLLPSSQGFTVTAKEESEDGDYVIVDGPFTEAKETIGGYAILDVGSKDEALMWSKRFLDIVGHGFSEVRLMFQPQDGEPDLVKGQVGQVQS